jgi:hypothetical protein
MRNQFEAEYFSKLLASCFHPFSFLNRLMEKAIQVHRLDTKSLVSSLATFDNMTPPAELDYISDLHLLDSSISSDRIANPSS